MEISEIFVFFYPTNTFKTYSLYLFNKDLLNVYIMSDTVVDVRDKKMIKSLKILYFL